MLKTFVYIYTVKLEARREELDTNEVTVELKDCISGGLYNRASHSILLDVSLENAEVLPS